MATSEQSNAKGQRIHFMDRARALFMLLGAPFHAALVYTAAPWLVQSPDTSALLGWFPPVFNGFCMQGFFLIAGFFAALLLERQRPAEWVRARFVRLGIPLLAGMALIVPLQFIMLHGALDRGAVHMPRSAAGLLFSHLWFLPVLLMLCAVLALVWKFAVQWRWPNLPFWAWGLAFGIWEVALRALSSMAGDGLRPLGGLIDLHTALTYAPFFLLGVAARRSSSFFVRLTRCDLATIILGIAAMVLFTFIWQPETRLEVIASLMARSMAAICVSQSILAWMASKYDKPSPFVDRLVDASFSIYLLHHPIVIGMALVLLAVPFPPLLEWAVISVVAIGLSYALHRLIRRSPILLLLFNGVPMRHGEGVLLAANARPPS